MKKKFLSFILLIGLCITFSYSLSGNNSITTKSGNIYATAAYIAAESGDISNEDAAVIGVMGVLHAGVDGLVYGAVFGGAVGAWVGFGIGV